MTTLSLAFNGNQLTPVSHNSQIWLTSVELAKSLGYADEKSVNRIFARNKDEFADSMTTVLSGGQIDPLGESSSLQRIFSLRGCHLIAMFSRTTIAKEFRKWVLDILDKQPVQYGLKSLPPSPYISEAESQQLRKSIATHCQKTGVANFGQRYKDVYDFFNITSYKLIPAGKLNEAARLAGVKLVVVKKPVLPTEPLILTFTQEQVEQQIAEAVKRVQGKLVEQTGSSITIALNGETTRFIVWRTANSASFHEIDGSVFVGDFAQLSCEFNKMGFALIAKSKLEEMQKQIGAYC